MNSAKKTARWMKGESTHRKLGKNICAENFLGNQVAAIIPVLKNAQKYVDFSAPIEPLLAISTRTEDGIAAYRLQRYLVWIFYPRISAHVMFALRTTQSSTSIDGEVFLE